VRSIDMEKATPAGWLAAGLAFLLVIDPTNLALFSYVATLRVGGATVSLGASLTATDAPDAWLGVLAAIAALLVLDDVVAHRLSPETPLPAQESREMTRFVLASAAYFFMGLKFLLHLESFRTSEPGSGLGQRSREDSCWSRGMRSAWYP
jgi:hypothetical protein